MEWTNRDFEELSDRIASATGVTLSVTTLKRVWGRVSYASQPSTTTLDTLAQYAGHEHWRAYRSQYEAPAEPVPAAPPPAPPTYRRRTYLLLPLLLLVGLAFWWYRPEDEPPAPPPVDAADYYFDLQPVTSGVPNSVVFTYDASAAPTEEVYLQQSWDERRRERLSRSGTTHTSIYYLPGYYSAKLVVADQIVSEHELLIRSEGWLAAIESEPVPVYLPVEEDSLEVTVAELEALGIPLQPNPPTTVITRVGDLGGVYSNDFAFRTRFRQTYAAGAAACRHVEILLLLKNSAIIVPFSAPGCVAELRMYAGEQTFSGRDHDLSAFGVVNDGAVELACYGTDGLLTFHVNGREVYRVEHQEEVREIIGLRYLFAGTGAVEEVELGGGAGGMSK